MGPSTTEGPKWSLKLFQSRKPVSGSALVAMPATKRHDAAKFPQSKSGDCFECLSWRWSGSLKTWERSEPKRTALFDIVNTILAGRLIGRRPFAFPTRARGVTRNDT
jgi:hypothetical protein